MDLLQSVTRRKSCRKYESEPLPQATLDEIETAVKGFTPLYPDVPLGHRYAGATKGLFKIVAPHYLIISGQGKPGEREAAGFLYQQLVLWLDQKELGSVWLGATRDADKANRAGDIITIALGRTTEPVHRSPEGFVRKPIGQITNIPGDPCVQAAHLAPSGMNLQPWYFEKADDRVRLYQAKLRPPASLVYKMADVDMGIALCHYALACRQAGKPFAFTRTEALPAKPGYLPFGIVE